MPFFRLSQLCGFALLGLLGSRFYFSVQVEDPNIIALGHDYLSIVTVLSIGCFGQVLLSRLLQSTGKTFYSMVIQMVGCWIEPCAGPYYDLRPVGFPEMGVAGAALQRLSASWLAQRWAFITICGKTRRSSLVYQRSAPAASHQPNLRSRYSVDPAADSVFRPDFWPKPDFSGLFGNGYGCLWRFLQAPGLCLPADHRHEQRYGADHCL